MQLTELRIIRQNMMSEHASQTQLLLFKSNNKGKKLEHNLLTIRYYS